MGLRPLLRRSIKAYKVAVDQYKEGTPEGNESCVESCDKAIELILKAKVKDMGQSIYFKAGDPRTIDFKEALRRLAKQNIAVPEHKKLRKIHECRNPTHHIGETVSRARTKSVLAITFKFIERFLRDEFNLELRDIVKPRHYYEVLDQVITRNRSVTMMIDEGHLQLNRIDEARSTIPKEYESVKVLLNWLAIKKKLRLGRQKSLSNKSNSNNRSLRMSKIVDALVADQTLPEESRANFDVISKMYDKAVNTREEITWDDYNPYGLAMLRLKGKLELITR